MAAASENGEIKEGSAEILPVRHSGNAEDNGRPESGKQKKAGSGDEQNVFYNRAQVFNRDLSVLVLNVFSMLKASEEAEKQKKWDEKEARRRENPTWKPPAVQHVEYKGLSILEGLSASGLRSIRYWKEVKGVDKIVVNDFEATAVEHIRRNVEHNKLSTDKVRPNHGDVNVHLYNNAKVYDVIDLDPYGTASPFLDAALAGVKNGGLVCVTSTDMPVLGGNVPETCFYRYGGTALKAKYVHEMSLRLLMNAIAATAARHQRHVEPLVSCSIDFYVRVFVRVHDTPVRVKELASKTGLVYQCCQCDSFHIQPLGLLEFGSKKARRNDKHETQSGAAAQVVATTEAAVAAEPAPTNKEVEKDSGSVAGTRCQQPTPALPSRYKVPKAVDGIGSTCEECEGRYSIGGPFYLGNLYSKEFVDACLSVCDNESLEHVTSWKKITGMLTAISEEIEDIPLHYSLPSLCASVRLGCAPAKHFKGMLQHLGYRVSHFHREPAAIKTDAPNAVVFDILRTWAQHEGKPVGSEHPGAAGIQQDASAATEDANDPVKADGHKSKKQKGGPDPLATKILQRPIATAQLHDIKFGEVSIKDEERPRKLPRFLPNPEKYWGPMARAKPQRGGEGDVHDTQEAAADSHI